MRPVAPCTVCGVFSRYRRQLIARSRARALRMAAAAVARWRGHEPSCRMEGRSLLVSAHAHARRDNARPQRFSRCVSCGCAEARPQDTFVPCPSPRVAPRLLSLLSPRTRGIVSRPVSAERKTVAPAQSHLTLSSSCTSSRPRSGRNASETRGALLSALLITAGFGERPRRPTCCRRSPCRGPPAAAAWR